MRETERLERQLDVTVRRVAEEELATVNVTASGKPDCPTTGTGAFGSDPVLVSYAGRSPLLRRRVE